MKLLESYKLIKGDDEFSLNEAKMNAFKKAEAYWITPYNIVIEVGNNHMDTVSNNPTEFGINDEYIKSKYDKHGEKYGLEGKAREEILVELISSGYIRIRSYRNFWSITINKLTSRVIDKLYDWSVKMVNDLKYSKWDEIKVNTLNNDTYETDLNGLTEFSLLKKLKEEVVKMSDINKLTESYLACKKADNKKIIPEHECYIKESYDDSLLFEMRLNRVWQHGKNGFMMMSAFRWSNTLEENMKLHKQLKQDLRDNNLGFAEIDGSYQDSVTKEVSDELSVFIPFNPNKYSKEEFESKTRELGKKYKQDSVLFMMDGEAFFFYSDGRPDNKMGTKISFGKHGDVHDEDTGKKIGEVYSKMRKDSHGKHRETDVGGKPTGNTQQAIHYVVEGCRRPSSIMAIRGFDQLWSNEYK